MGETNKECETLFLLEVSVNELSISHPHLEQDQKSLSTSTETCVKFQFLHYQPLVVCDSDNVGSEVGENMTFRSGKSCFFSLRTPRGNVPFDVKVTVISRSKEGTLPGNLEIGTTSIQMGAELKELLQRHANCEALQISNSKQGVFEIRDGRGSLVGTLSALLNLSCFGNSIITQFTLDTDEKSYLFKRADVGKCPPDVESSLPNFINAPATQQPMSLHKDSYGGQKDPCQEISTGNNYCVPDRQVGRCSKSFPPQEGERLCPPNTLLPEQRPNFCNTYTPPCPQPFPKEFCECPYPAPPSTVSKIVQQSQKTNLDLTPGEVGVEDDRVVFQLPPGFRQEKQVISSACYKFTSVLRTRDGEEKKTINVTPDVLRARRGGGAEGLEDVFFMVKVDKCDDLKRRRQEQENTKESKMPTAEKNTQWEQVNTPLVEGQAKEEPTKGKKGKDKGKKGNKKKK